MNKLNLLNLIKLNWVELNLSKNSDKWNCVILIYFFTILNFSLHHITLHYITLHYMTIHSIPFHHTIRHSTLHSIIHYITMYDTIYYITIHYNTFNYITSLFKFILLYPDSLKVCSSPSMGESRSPTG